VFIDKNISTLINYINNESKSYSFNALKFQQNYGHYVQEKAITEEDLQFTADVKIEFPDILLDEEEGVPVVILTKLNLLEALIFKDQLNTSFSKFKSTMECPLFLLGNNELSQSIGYYYNLNAFKQLLDHHNFTEPRTRKPFCGGLVLTDTDRFDAYNDYVISATYFDGKKVNYNSGLFYYVLWKLCTSKEWMDKNVVDQFFKYVKRRIETTTCKIGLSSFPMDPQMNTSLLTALWYCVDLSSEIFKNDKTNYAHERLRQYHGIAKDMIFILTQFNYDLQMDSIDKRLNIIGHVMALKRMHSVQEKKYFILSRIFKTVDGFITNTLERPQDIYKLNYVKLYHKGMLPDSVMNDEVNSLEDYVLFLNQPIKNLQDTDGVEICKDTFRPYFVVDGKAFYAKALKTMQEVVIEYEGNNMCISYVPLNRYSCEKVLSLYKLYTDCVADNTGYPTLEDYTGYILKKKKFSGSKVVVFPFDIHQSIREVYDQYQTVIANVDVDTFIKTCKLNVARIDRIKQEGVAKFNNDDEIIKFITAEERDAQLTS